MGIFYGLDIDSHGVLPVWPTLFSPLTLPLSSSNRSLTHAGRSVRINVMLLPLIRALGPNESTFCVA